MSERGPIPTYTDSDGNQRPIGGHMDNSLTRPDQDTTFAQPEGRKEDHSDADDSGISAVDQNLTSR